MERSITARLNGPPRVDVRLHDRQRVTMKMHIAGVGIEWYEGEYIVIPETYDQTLATELKRMRDDVTVLAIPYVETTNPAGGITAAIAQ